MDLFSVRQKRVSDLVSTAISEVLAHDYKDKNVITQAQISVDEIEMTRDLR